MPRRWDLAGLIGGKVIFVSWAIVIPMLVYPWWAVISGYLVYSMVVSLIMAVTFQLAHCVEEADFATAEELASERRLWAVHEVETTVDFCPVGCTNSVFPANTPIQPPRLMSPRMGRITPKN